MNVFLVFLILQVEFWAPANITNNCVFRDWGCERIQPALPSKNKYEFAGEFFKPNVQLLLFLLSFPGFIIPCPWLFQHLYRSPSSKLQPSTLHLRWSAHVSPLWFTVSLGQLKSFQKLNNTAAGSQSNVASPRQGFGNLWSNPLYVFRINPNGSAYLKPANKNSAVRNIQNAKSSPAPLPNFSRMVSRVDQRWAPKSSRHPSSRLGSRHGPQLLVWLQKGKLCLESSWANLRWAHSVEYPSPPCFESSIMAIHPLLCEQHLPAWHPCSRSSHKKDRGKCKAHAWKAIITLVREKSDWFTFVCGWKLWIFSRQLGNFLFHFDSDLLLAKPLELLKHPQSPIACPSIEEGIVF